MGCLPHRQKKWEAPRGGTACAHVRMALPLVAFGHSMDPKVMASGSDTGPSEVNPRKETAFHHVPSEGNTPAKHWSSIPKQLVFRSVSRASLPAPGPAGSGPHVTGGDKSLEKQFHQPGKPARAGACTGGWEMRWGLQHLQSLKRICLKYPQIEVYLYIYLYLYI